MELYNYLSFMMVTNRYYRLYCLLVTGAADEQQGVSKR